jgi:hypothetical protein
VLCPNKHQSFAAEAWPTSVGEPPTSITGAGRSACPQEGAGNLSERFLAKEQFLAKERKNGFWRKNERTVSGERTVPAKRIAEC